MSYRLATLTLALAFVAAGAHAAAPRPIPPGQPDPMQANAPVHDDLFAGTEKFAKDASEVTEITQDPSTLAMVRGGNAGKARRTILSVVRTYSYDKPGMYNPADVEVFRKRLETGDWSCSVHTRDFKHGESTDICNRARTDGYTESAIITVEPKELTFIHTIRKRDDDSRDDKGRSVWMPEGLPGILPVDTPTPDIRQIEIEARLEAMNATRDARMAEFEAVAATRSLTGDARAARLDQLRQLRKELAPLAPMPPQSFHGPTAPMPPDAPQAPDAAPSPEPAPTPDAAPMPSPAPLQ